MSKEPELKGFQALFNSTTTKGRANVAMATLGAIGMIVLYKKATGGKTAAPEAPKK